MIIRLALLAALVTAFATARADEPKPPPAAAPAALTADEIVQRASAQLARKPKKLVCTVAIKAMQLGSDGKPKETQESELTETWKDGVADEGIAYKRSVDGTPLTPAEMAKADTQEKEERDEMKAHREKGEGGSVDSPLEAAQLKRHRFALVRKDKLGDREVYVLSVEPLSQAANESLVTRQGTLQIDAQTFLPLQLDTHASPMPSHVSKMDFTEEFASTADGETVPKTLIVTVKGGILFFTKTYRVETRWRDCK